MSAVRKTRKFGVSGAGVDRDGYDSAGVALSAAITFAGRAPGEAVVYVRRPDDRVVGRVERDADGNLSVYGERHYPDGGAR